MQSSEHKKEMNVEPQMTDIGKYQKGEMEKRSWEMTIL